jgi:hypothetical protein
MTDNEIFSNPTPKQALYLATVFVEKSYAMAYWDKAITAFREALGETRPRGAKADEICYDVLGRNLAGMRRIAGKLNEHFGTKRTFHL